MKKTYALVISLIVTLMLLINLSFLDSKKSDREIVKISRAIDGDTLELSDGRVIRLLNVNSPEKKTYGSNLSFIFLIVVFETEITGNPLEIASITDKGKRSVIEGIMNKSQA